MNLRLAQQAYKFASIFITLCTFFIKVIAASKTYEEIEDKWYDIMQYGLELQYTVEPHLQKDVLRRIKKYYFKNDPISADNMESFVNVS